MRPGGYSQSCDILPEFRDKYAQNDDCMHHYTSTVYTHIHIDPTRIFFAQISCTRHFFRSSANKEICDLEAIRRAVIFYLNFVINMPRTMTA